jgi:hypothetical protein
VVVILSYARFISYFCLILKQKDAAEVKRQGIGGYWSFNLYAFNNSFITATLGLVFGTAWAKLKRIFNQSMASCFKLMGIINRAVVK